MNQKIISKKQEDNRSYWIKEISILSGNFGIDATKLEAKIDTEVNKKGIECLLGHLRLCGAIPESYGHDTSEEKLYSKYTDVIIHQAYKMMGFNSLVLKERADVADVECVSNNYSFVADAKAFRLSRTAKNQKDFKVQAMDNWKHGKPYAMVVCPVYQLPSKSSQIYQQAGARSVYISTYTHLSLFIQYAKQKNKSKCVELLHNVFKSIDAMNPSKDASCYWQTVNQTILNFDSILRDIWQNEKKASIEAIDISRKEALSYLASERQRIMHLSKEDAIKEIILASKIDNRIKAINSVSDNGLLGIG